VPVLEQVLETFPDQVKVVFKNYPLLRAHKFSEKATLAAYAAHLHGKFWTVHNELFKYQGDLNDDKIQNAIRSAGLNLEQIERERNSQSVISYIQKDLNEAIRIGVNSVPTVFVKGKRLRDRSFESIAAAVEKELKKNPAKR
jgi:protein-disulfide isomerase